MNEISIYPIGSGSTGNCFFLQLNGHRLLIDLGIGLRKVSEALKSCELCVEDLEAVFITHGHGDHVKAAGPLGNHLQCPVFCDPSVMYALRGMKKERTALEAGVHEVYPGLEMTVFNVPHDFVKTSGYVFSSGGKKIGYVTDCGRMNEQIIGKLSGADVIIIEANHDVEMLKHGPYPYFLQKRILSEYGHLSNADCADTVRILHERGTSNFLLAHLSLKNNTPEKALETVKEALDDEVFLYVCPPEGNRLLTF